MDAHWLWLIPGGIFLAGCYLTRFRPLLALGGAALPASLVAFRGQPVWVQAILFLVAAAGLEWVHKRFQYALRRRRPDPGLRRLAGHTGKLRDIVDPRQGVFLMHLDGQDLLAVAAEGAVIALGDQVEVVGASGRRAVVRKRND